MELKVLGSSSNGNCYILDNGKEALIIEAGVRFQEVKKALGYNLRKVVGCLITHRHNDHAKYIKAMVDNGFHTLTLADVWENKGVWGSRSVAIVPKHGYKLGRFKVLPFNACHDVPCVGYLIEHPECGRIMFLTDSCECLSLFPRLNHILIECNYSMAKLIEAVNAGVTPKSQIDRLPNSHMELQTCKSVLSELDLANVFNIVLLHLSDHNSDRLRFVSEIERQTGKAVYAAAPNMDIDITKF